MTAGSSSKDKKGEKTPPDRPKRSQIDDNLRRAYDDLLEDDVPDRFEDLLRRLKEQDSRK